MLPENAKLQTRKWLKKICGSLTPKRQDPQKLSKKRPSLHFLYRIKLHRSAKNYPLRCNSVQGGYPNYAVLEKVTPNVCMQI